MKNKIDPVLIAPCGMNCAICSGYLSYSNNLKISKCIGCRPRNKQCAYIKKQCKNGPELLKGEIDFCYRCPLFPCDRLVKLDKRYRTDYGMSMIENLKFIKKNGIEKFIQSQYRKYRCKKCGGLKSVHNNKCFKCEMVTSWRN